MGAKVTGRGSQEGESVERRAGAVTAEDLQATSNLFLALGAVAQVLKVLDGKMTSGI